MERRTLCRRAIRITIAFAVAALRASDVAGRVGVRGRALLRARHRAVGRGRDRRRDGLLDADDRGGRHRRHGQLRGQPERHRSERVRDHRRPRRRSADQRADALGDQHPGQLRKSCERPAELAELAGRRTVPGAREPVRDLVHRPDRRQSPAHRHSPWLEPGRGRTRRPLAGRDRRHAGDARPRRRRLDGPDGRARGDLHAQGQAPVGHDRAADEAQRRNHVRRLRAEPQGDHGPQVRDDLRPRGALLGLPEA